MENSSNEDNGSLPNRYELAIIAAREARRANDILRRSNEEAETKVTLTAIEKVSKGRVKYTYESEEGQGE